MKIALIAALTRSRVIGRGGKLPWHIPDDLKRFRRLTTGHAVVMGRKTFEALGKPLPHRRNIVITSRDVPGIETYRSTQDALRSLADQERIFIIGGGQLFAQVLDLADELFLTIVDSPAEGDTFFPPYEHLLGTRFRQVSHVEGKGYIFEDYVRSPRAV